MSLEITRRHFFRDCGVGLGKIALAGLLTDALAGRAPAALPVRKPHFAPKVKRVIHLFMAGAPSHLDLFDPKPQLAKLEGKPLPPSVIGGQRYAFIRPDAAVMGPDSPARTSHSSASANWSSGSPPSARPRPPERRFACAQ